MLIGVVLALVMAATFAAAWAGSRAAAIALVLEAAVWLRVDVAFEGPHVLRVTERHGLVLADLVALAAFAAAVLAWRRRRSEPGHR